MSAKILLFDIETAPNLANVWGMWGQDIPSIMFEEHWYLLTWSAKWLDEREVLWDALPEHKTRFKKDLADDYGPVHSLWKLLDAADIVIAHNGDKFDIRKINTRFLLHGLDPPSPYKTIDTLKVARRNFAFTSNRLDDLGEMLDLGRKAKHPGFPMWRGCMQGDIKSFDKMVKYNKQDVRLLQNVYLALRPWMKNHPNLAVYDSIYDEDISCPKCGSRHVNWKGYNYTAVAVYPRFRCMKCGGQGQARKKLPGSVKTKNCG